MILKETFASVVVTEEELFADPYPVYDKLRAEAPLYWHPGMSAFLATRWDDCEAILSDPESFSSITDKDALVTSARAFGGDSTVLSTNGPIHADLRKAVDGPLRPRAVKDHMDALVRPIVKTRIEELAKLDRTELMASYFEPVSVRCLGQLLGIEGVDDDTLRRWFSSIISGLINDGLGEEGFADSDRAGREMGDVIRPIIERVTATPDNSALSHMVHDGRVEGNPRTADELLPTIHVYIAGGMQEPGHGAGSTLLGLLGEPEQLGRVVADPALVPRAVEEGLRWIAPIGHAERQALRDVEINGVLIKEGERVLCMLSAANRDPEKFEDPHRFDIDRGNTRHMAFGGGRHFCAGNSFGRAIIRVSIEELLAAFPEIALDPSEPPRVNGWHFRSPRTLPVALGR
jgi:cytochrome P450